MLRAYIKQRTDNDCGIAALAMACDLQYEQVAAGLVIAQGLTMLLAEAIQTEGANDDIVKAWLCNNGWAWQEITRNVWVKGAFISNCIPGRQRPLHRCTSALFEATKGWHYCVMDFDGSVRDPWNKERGSACSY